MAEALVISIAGSLVAAFILWNIRGFNLSLGRLRVHGRWLTAIRGQPSLHENVVLRQLGSRVWGASHSAAVSDRRIVKKYRLRGQVHGESLSMLFSQYAGEGMDHGAVLLRINPTDGSMSGWEIGYNLQTGWHEPFRYVWTRGTLRDLEQLVRADQVRDATPRLPFPGSDGSS